MNSCKQGVIKARPDVEIHPIDAWPSVRSTWTELALDSPHTSFFLTVDWVETWIQTFGELLKPDILLFRAQGRPVAACLLVRKCEKRGPFTVRRIYLNTAGEDERDNTTVEFNTVLCLAGWEEAVAVVLAEHLQQQNWDEIACYGVVPGIALDTLERSMPNVKPLHSLRPSYYVDLAALRQKGIGYENVLGNSTRKHLRQNVRHYQKLGALRTEIPRDINSAIRLLQLLAELHQDAWTQRGRPGAFSSQLFASFHRKLLERTYGTGVAQLIATFVGDEPVGVLYNFVYRRKVYFYQSGLRYTADNRLSPGLVCCAYAITQCLEQGLDEFDFLAGGSQYKQAWSTHVRQLDWLVFRRNSTKMAVIEALRYAKDTIRRLKSRSKRALIEGKR